MKIPFLNVLRTAEIQRVIDWYRPLFEGKRILEIGSGTGAQLNVMGELASEVTGVDLADGTYAAVADPRIISYDGHVLPFRDGAFDLVFSSNVLEHIAHWDEFQKEIARVLAPDGRCVHVLPTHHWRFWTTLVTVGLSPITLAVRMALSVRDRKWLLPKTMPQILDLIIGERHGEFGTRLSEYEVFKPTSWADAFSKAGWHIVEMRPIELFYEGNMVLGGRLSIAQRTHLSRIFGSSCEVFVLRKQS